MTNLNTTLAPDAEAPLPDPRPINSVDATAGHPMVVRIMARKHELEALLAGLPEDAKQEQSDITLALSTINELLTGDLARVPPVVVADMSRWLERNKHLAERASAPAAVAASTETAVDVMPIPDEAP